MEQIKVTKWKSFFLRTLWISILCFSMILSPTFGTQASNEKKVALVMKALTNPFFSTMESGAKKYAQQENIPLEVLESLGISLLYGISVISFMFLLTGFMKRSITAIIAGILSYFMVLPLVSSVLQGIDVEPWFVVTYSAGLITEVLGATGDAGFGPGKHMTVPGFEPDLGLGILVMAVYSLVLFTLAMTVSLKRTME